MIPAGASHRLILVVEDEPLVRGIARDGLEDSGHTVLEAWDAEGALKVLRARPDIDVLFTDVNMPGLLDGLDLAEIVRREWPAVRVVMTSGRPIERALPDDSALLRKPYSLSELSRLMAER